MSNKPQIYISEKSSYKPKPVLEYSQTIAIGTNNTIVLTTAGEVVVLGRNAANPLAGLSGVTAIGAGNLHSLAVSGGLVSSWGENAKGQLGADPAQRQHQ